SPFYWTAQLRMALVLDALDRDPEARAQLETMAAAHPDRPEPLIELGDIERSHSNFDAAADAYSRGLARIPDPSPQQWRIYYSRGVAYERSTSGRRPRPISNARSNCNPISRWCSTIWAIPGSTRARISTRACV